MTSPAGLPRLPPLPTQTYTHDRPERFDLFDAAQMRAYALAARADLQVKVDSWEHCYKQLAEHATTQHEQLAQRDERIREQQLVEDRLRRSWHEDVEREQKRAEAAEAELKDGGPWRVKLVEALAESERRRLRAEAAEARIKELEQSAEVAARNMRDLVAEHVRELEALSERVKELEQWA